MKKTIQNQRGQGLIEYIILVALLAVATVGITRILGETVKKKYAEITYAISGTKRSLGPAEIQERHYSKSDLSNFMNGSASTSRRHR